MDEVGARLDAELHTTLCTADVHVLNLRALREVLHDGGTVEDGIHLQVLIEVLRHIAKDDVQSLTKQFLEGVCEVVEQQGSQAALCFLLRFAAHQAIDVLCIAVYEVAQDVDAQIACSTCDQHIAQLLALTRTEEP